MGRIRKYDYAHDFSEGMALVRRDGKFGFIDTTGYELVPCMYDGANDFNEGMACVELKGKWGYVDRCGHLAIPCIYDQAYDFNDGLAKVCHDPVSVDGLPFGPSDSRTFFIDEHGTEVLSDGKELDIFSEGLARIIRNEKTGFVDRCGREVIACKYDGATIFREGFSRVSEIHLLPEEEQTDDMDYYTKEGFIDITGREITPCIYDDTGDFHDGMALVCRDGMYGYIDRTGREVIPIQYDWAHDFHDGLAQVQTGENACFIDRGGRVVLNLSQLGVLAAYDFSEELAVAVTGRGGERGYIDKTGRLVIPCRYQEAFEFHDGLARVMVGNEFRFIDRTGRELDKTKETSVLLSGTRETIIRILNGAFRMCSNKEFRIADGDSLEAINRKIDAANKHMAGYQTGFTLMDYLDDRARMDSPFKERVLWYIDVEEPDGSENYDANPAGVTAEGEEYTLTIVSRVREGQHTYYPEDWQYWCGMMSVYYDCLIKFKKENA